MKQQPSTRAGTPTTTVTSTTNTPTVTPTANMPTVTSVQAGPRQTTAMMQPGGLIDATRLMIDRHHKTMHQAFLAMDKASAASSILAEHTRGLACSSLAQISQPGPDLPGCASSERAARKQTNNPARHNPHQDRNGRIDRDEIRTALANWNMPPAPHEVDAIFSACDVIAG